MWYFKSHRNYKNDYKTQSKFSVCALSLERCWRWMIEAKWNTKVRNNSKERRTDKMSWMGTRDTENCLLHENVNSISVRANAVELHCNGYKVNPNFHWLYWSKLLLCLFITQKIIWTETNFKEKMLVNEYLIMIFACFHLGRTLLSILILTIFYWTNCYFKIALVVMLEVLFTD